MKKKKQLHHHVACFSLLLLVLVLVRPDMAVCAAPALDWTDNYGLWNDGVTPDYGISSFDSFTFEISYQDSDDNPPLAGYPKVFIKKDGVDILGSPFTLIEDNELDENYKDGKLYTYSTTLNQAGNDYTYSFVAHDNTSQLAYGIPANEHTLTVVTGYVWVDKVLGNDSTGNGSEASPYQTITKGLSVASAGQAVKVRGGTIASPYTCSETVTMVNGVHMVSENGDGGDSEALYDDPHSDYETSMLTRSGRVVIQGIVSIHETITEDVLVDGFTIDYNPGMTTMRMSSSPIIRNNIIRRGGDTIGTSCVQMRGVSGAETNPTIENNLIHSVLGKAIGISPYTNPLIQDNEIWDTGAYPGIGINRTGVVGGEITILNNHIFQCGGPGIGSIALVNQLKMIIRGNSIHDNGYDITAPETPRGAGINLKRCCAPFYTLEIIIGGSEPGQGNQIYNNYLAGIKLDGNGLSLNPVLIQNNDIYNNGKAGILLIDAGHSGGMLIDPAKALILDNSIHDHAQGAGINIGGSTYADIAYNSIYDNYSGIAFNMGELEIDPDPPSSDTVTIEENDIYINTMAGIAVVDAITGEVTIGQ